MRNNKGSIPFFRLWGVGKFRICLYWKGDTGITNPVTPTKKVSIYGESAASFKPSRDWGFKSYTELVNESFPTYKINWNGVGTSSLQRTVSSVQRDKNSDLLIIFHSSPKYIYFPGFERDVDLDDVLLASKNIDHANMLCRTINETPESLKQIFQIWSEKIYDKSLLRSQYISLLILLNKVLQKRNVIHIPRDKSDSLFLNGTINNKIRECLHMAGRHPTYIPKDQHDLVAKQMISAISSALTD